MGQNLSILLYSSQKQASVGDIVEINIRNNVDYGLVLSENIEEKQKHNDVTATTVSPQEIQSTLNPSDRIFGSAQGDGHNAEEKIANIQTTKSEVLSKKFEIKEINKILPIKLSHSQIQFLKIFADNTFNSLNDTWDAISQSYGLLTQKQWKLLEEKVISNIKAINSDSKNNGIQTDSSSNKTQNPQNDRFIEDKNSDNVPKNYVSTNSPIKAPKVEFLINLDIKVRIMYIIRSLTCDIQNDSKALKQGINRQFLIVFPEKKYLNKFHKYINNEILKSKELSDFVELLYYASEPTKKPKECIWSMLNFENGISNVIATPKLPQETQIVLNPPQRILRSDAQNDDQSSSKNNELNQTSQNNNNYIAPKLQIILSTRSGLFLPFTALTDIILVDEGNSMYIQDQNSLYYDTREAIFLISKAFNANISFISPLPSIRLYNMYDKQTLEQEMINNQAVAQKPRRIKITRFDKKSSKYDLFGYEIEQILEETKA
jgi:hypothetical protein